MRTIDAQGLPVIKPPYGTITAINLDTGEFVWQVAHGETPDVVRNSPALKGLTIPRTGQAGHAGTLVTKTLVISGDPLATTIPSHGRGAILHAYDKATGKEVGAVYYARAAEWHADDVHAGRKAVHRARDWRRNFFRRVYCVAVAEGLNSPPSSAIMRIDSWNFAEIAVLRCLVE